MMKVAIFARSLWRKPTGRGYYAREMIGAFRRLGRPMEIDLFSGEDAGLEGCRFLPARGGNPCSDLWRVVRGIGRDVRAHRPDLFWSTTHFLPSGLPSTMPKIVTVLDLVWKDHPETLTWQYRLAGRWLERSILHAGRIICISEFTRDRLLVHWPEAAPRAVVIPLAANPRLRRTEGASRCVEERFGLAGPFILNVDTIEPRKNLSLILDALQFLPDVTFVHCGPVGWNTSALVDRMKGMKNVRLLGYVDEESLSALYSQAVAAVFPTIYEGFHLPPLDAASVGAPVVASDIPVHREVLGDAALYFPLGDPEALARQVRGLMDSPGEAAERSAAGRARAGKFSWDGAARQAVDLFESVCRDSRSVNTPA